MKLKIFSAISLVFFLFNGSVFAQNQLGPENCCYHIWAAGCRLGWATSHMYYTQTRPYWEEGPDRRIYDNILGAGWHIEKANRTCNPGATQAWPNWKLKKDRLERIATSFGNNPTPHNREQLAKELWTTQGFSTPLRVVVSGTQIYNEATCSEKYFKMGWWIGYIQQTLQIANESLGYGNPQWRDQVQHAKNLMGNLLNVLSEYQNLTPTTGYCASSGADLIRRVRDIQGRGISPSNLEYMMNGFNIIWEKGQITISNDCPLGATHQDNDGNKATKTCKGHTLYGGHVNQFPFVDRKAGLRFYDPNHDGICDMCNLPAPKSNKAKCGQKISKEELVTLLREYKNIVKTQWVPKRVVTFNTLYSINIGLGRDVNRDRYLANVEIWKQKVNCYNNCVQAHPSPSQKPSSADFKRFRTCTSECNKIRYMKCP